MSKELDEFVWKRLEGNRGNRPPRSEDLASILRDFNRQITVPELVGLLERFAPDIGMLVPPVWMLRFINQYLGRKKIEAVLDPWAGVGVLALNVAEHLHAEQVVALERHPQPLEFTKFVGSHEQVNWTIAPQFDWLETNKQQFDLVISMPPIGYAPERRQFHLPNGKNVEILDELGRLVLLGACQHLSQTGFGIFVVADSFFFQRKQGVYNSLKNFGLYLDAVLSIPPGTFHGLGIPTSLVVVKKQQPKGVFVAEITDIAGKNVQVLSNLRARQDAKKNIAFGTLVDADGFRGYHQLQTQRQLEALKRSQDFEGVRLTDVVLHMTLGKSGSDFAFEERENAVYLPIFATGDAVTSQAEMRNKPQNYIQLVLDPEVAYAPYVAGWLNSTAGRLQRQLMASSTHIPRLTRAALTEQFVFYLPSLSDQHSIVETDTLGEATQHELTELRNQLWAVSANEAAQIRARLNAFRGADDHEVRFEDWIQSQPFPLASILWAYHATNDPFKKYRLLLRYFEGFAQFMATVLLSAVLNEPEWFIEKKSFLTSQDLNWSQSSFGTWTSIVANLTKSLNTRLASGNPDHIAMCERAFQAPAPILPKLFPSDLSTVIRKTNELRNRWRGHGGIDDTVAQSRLIELEQHLNDTRQILGRAWENYRLIQPWTFQLVAGAYKGTVKELVGHHNPFRQVSVSLDEPLDSAFIYLYSPHQTNALKLQPLIRIFTQLYGEQNACYFYSRVKNSQAVFISHHFEKKPEVEEIFSDTLALLNQLNNSNEEA